MTLSPGRYLMIAIATAAVTSAGNLHAQSCRGLPELNGSRLNVGAQTSATGAGRSLAGIAGYAAPRVFGELQVGREGNAYSNLHRQAYIGTVGLSTQVGSTGAAICPVLSYGYVGGVTGTPYSNRTTTASIGVAIGRAFSVSTTTLTPFLQASVSRSAFAFRPVSFQIQEDTWSLLPVVGDRRTSVSWLGQLVVGSGFRISDRVTFAPSMGIPLEKRREFTFGIAATVTVPR